MLREYFEQAWDAGCFTGNLLNIFPYPRLFITPRQLPKQKPMHARDSAC